jgi:hypothetical protein
MAPLYKPQVADAIIFPAEIFSPGEEFFSGGKFFLQ